MDYKNLSDEERIELLKIEPNDAERAFIVRSFSSDELKLRYIHFVKEECNKSSVTYGMTNEEGKMKIMETIQNEKTITSVALELVSNENKIKLLSRIKNTHYIALIILSINENDAEIINALDYVDNERYKALIIAKLTDNNLKIKYLDEITDDVNKSKIVATLEDNDELKLEYIEKVDDEPTKSILIASLKNKQLKEQFLKKSENKYSKINIPEGMTIGLEIECEGENSLYAYLIKDILEGWEAKEDTSLDEGIEITSPALTNSENDAQDLYQVCKVLQDLGQSVSEKCGGHIHIGADYLKTKEAYANLVEIWSNNEELMLLLSNKNGELPREDIIKFATPISTRIVKAIDNGDFRSYSYLHKKEFIGKLKGVQGYKEKKLYGIRTSLNFINVESPEREINTIEFRVPNGTIDADTWIENANLFGGLVAASQKISDIQYKNIHEQDEDDRSVLEKFARLNNKELSNEERLEMLLDLCVPENLKQVYIERYMENSKLLGKNSELKEKLEKNIANETVGFSISKVGNMAKEGSYKEVKDAGDELKNNYKEYKNPTKNSKESKEL